ncbi:MAG: hypothetical protein JSV24_02535 [Bacteroidales bacterium]|nr:MAG: hypothetical protein JSV24_02535 [Bacteroidales bacterium]
MNLNPCRFFAWFIIGVGFILSSCQKLDLKKEIALSIYDVEILSSTSAKISGKIIDVGDGITEYGFVFSSTTSIPTILNSAERIINSGGSVPGEFFRIVGELDARVMYHVRTYATPDGTNYVYSDPISFIIKDIWTQKSDFGGDPRSGGIAFTVNDKGYIGMGVNDSKGELYDLWQYDPGADSWTQRAEFPSWTSVTSFYVATASLAIIGLQATSEVWHYDYSTNTWERINDFPGVGRRLGFSFQIGGKIYFGGGVVDDPDRIYPTDFWEYNPGNDLWTRKADFPAAGRENAVSFNIGNIGYAGLGFSITTTDEPEPKFDFWMYDPADESNGFDALGDPLGKWTRRADAPAATRFTGFTIDNRGFIFNLDRFLIFDPMANSWTMSRPFPGIPRVNAVGFELNGRAYVGTGDHEDGGGGIVYHKDFWEYTPDVF